MSVKAYQLPCSGKPFLFADRNGHKFVRLAGSHRPRWQAINTHRFKAQPQKCWHEFWQRQAAWAQLC